MKRNEDCISCSFMNLELIFKLFIKSYFHLELVINCGARIQQILLNDCNYSHAVQMIYGPKEIRSTILFIDKNS